MSAVTDSENSIYYDKENKPGISNLLTIYSSLKNITIEETEQHFKDYNYGNLKKEVAEKHIDLDTGDEIVFTGKVFSTALGDPWMDVHNLTVVNKVKKGNNK